MSVVAVTLIYWQHHTRKERECDTREEALTAAAYGAAYGEFAPDAIIEDGQIVLDGAELDAAVYERETSLALDTWTRINVSSGYFVTLAALLDCSVEVIAHAVRLDVEDLLDEVECWAEINIQYGLVIDREAREITQVGR
jgi:hypothetical protein